MGMLRGWVEKLPLEFRVLYKQFLLRVVIWRRCRCMRMCRGFWGSLRAY